MVNEQMHNSAHTMNENRCPLNTHSQSVTLSPSYSGLACALTNENPDRIHDIRLVRHPVHFDDRERMSVDGEHIVRSTRHIDQSESVSLALLDCDHCQIRLGPAWESAEAVNQTRVGKPVCARMCVSEKTNGGTVKQRRTVLGSQPETEGGTNP